VNELFRWAVEKTAKARESKGSWKYSIMSNIQKNRAFKRCLVPETTVKRDGTLKTEIVQGYTLTPDAIRNGVKPTPRTQNPAPKEQFTEWHNCEFRQ
jgi:hypothetical protein